MRRNIFLFFLSSTLVFGKVKIVTSTTDLADIAKTIGGDKAEVTSIARGNQDPHAVEVLPSYMLKVKNADLYFQVGMELDLWSNQIIDGSRNKNLKIVDCSKNINPLEIPRDKVDASMGDIHRLGNPHYWLDPENGKLIAETIANALSQTDPANKDYYQNRMTVFQHQVDEALEKWRSEFSILNGKRFIFYHNSWPYFAQRFGLNILEFVEPKPGIMPSPAHLERLINLIEAGAISAIAMETYFSSTAPDFLAEKTGIPVVKLSQSVGALPAADSYLNMIRANLETLKQKVSQ